MSQYEATGSAGRRAGRIRDWGVGLALVVAGSVSFIHLLDEYRAAGPWREARAAERAEARRKAEAEAAAPPVQTPPPAPPAPVEGPVEWVTAPKWPALTTYHLPEGLERASVQFRCQVNAEGVLSACVGVDTPAGTGLADRLLPALAEARMKPMLTDGRPLSGTVSFSVHFSAQAPAADEAAEDAREMSPAT